ncbi:hypothetical protein OIE66_22520 [Nonomuraea sp. NBC_01738]|uniref:hypothetical protein n=1 Tax=Nonomuraea sp. NBC_01738 TaxID=2976003 RepID=UPI002E0FE9F3|nr:hypothetical protein OIE66_22520 [Nonomuraea sp. NBC_01738]
MAEIMRRAREYRLHPASRARSSAAPADTARRRFVEEKTVPRPPVRGEPGRRAQGRRAQGRAVKGSVVRGRAES